MYSVESFFNEKDVLNNLLETWCIQEGAIQADDGKLWESCFFKKLKKRRKESHRS